MPLPLGAFLRLGVRLPLFFTATLICGIWGIWKRPTRLKRAGSQRSIRTVQVAGHRVIFGDALLLLLGHWTPPQTTERMLEVCVEVPDGPGPVHVLPASTGAEKCWLSEAYLTNTGSLRRELLFAWSVGCHLVAAGLRHCGCALPAMRVAAVVLPYLPDKQALLITRRAPQGGSYDSMWVFPGGVAEEGEAPATAAARELQEETGLLTFAENLRFLCAYQARNEQNCMTYLMLIYSGDVEGGELRLQRKEVAQAAFLTHEAVSRLLSGDPRGEADGVANGPASGDLVDRPVPLADFCLAKDSLFRTGPGIGGGHWFALQQWQRGLAAPLR